VRRRVQLLLLFILLPGLCRAPWPLLSASLTFLLGLSSSTRHSLSESTHVLQQRIRRSSGGAEAAVFLCAVAAGRPRAAADCSCTFGYGAAASCEETGSGVTRARDWGLRGALNLLGIYLRHYTRRKKSHATAWRGVLTSGRGLRSGGLWCGAGGERAGVDGAADVVELNADLVVSRLQICTPLRLLCEECSQVIDLALPNIFYSLRAPGMEH